MFYIFIAQLFFSFIVAFLVTYFLVPVVCKIANSLGIIDQPDGVIKKHEKATPYLGGVAVYMGFISSIALFSCLESSLFSLLVGSTVLLFVGLLDDLNPMKPYQKFLGQIIAAICFINGGFFLKEQFFQENYMIALPISLLWILTIINAFNLVDVMDGLATTIAIGSAFIFAFVALFFQLQAPALLLSALLGALVAFLWYNKPTAKIYLGDAGSLFLGGVLACVPFLFKWGVYNPYGYLAPAVILAIPLLEISTLVIIRTYKGIPFFRASPDHFSIYLRSKGWSKNFILVYVGLISLVLLGITLLFMTYPTPLSLLFFASIAGIAAWFSVIAF
jgi:UDP-GlcNAc:undecaprenyl-phosphate GlcNAc-1-phosphate transferase